MAPSSGDILDYSSPSPPEFDSTQPTEQSLDDDFVRTECFSLPRLGNDHIWTWLFNPCMPEDCLDKFHLYLLYILGKNFLLLIKIFILWVEGSPCFQKD